MKQVNRPVLDEFRHERKGAETLIRTDLSEKEKQGVFKLLYEYTDQRIPEFEIHNGQLKIHKHKLN